MPPGSILSGWVPPSCVIAALRPFRARPSHASPPRFLLPRPLTRFFPSGRVLLPSQPMGALAVRDAIGAGPAGAVAVSWRRIRGRSGWPRGRAAGSAGPGRWVPGRGRRAGGRRGWAGVRGGVGGAGELRRSEARGGARYRPHTGSVPSPGLLRRGTCPRRAPGRPLPRRSLRTAAARRSLRRPPARALRGGGSRR